MALDVGSRLGHYDVAALIGEGGMGQVYRATETKLKRQVALKILPEAFSADPERLARFQREAEVLASLNHPNIAAIHGLEEADGVRALVLELVEGPTLAERSRLVTRTFPRGVDPRNDWAPGTTCMATSSPTSVSAISTRLTWTSCMPNICTAVHPLSHSAGHMVWPPS